MSQSEKIILGHKMRMIHNGIDKYFDRMHKQDEIWVPRGQGMMLHYLMDHRDVDVYQKDLEEFFSISGATATNIIKGLEKNGLVTRVPNEKDARLKKIILTDVAIERELKIRENLKRFEESLRQGLTDQEVTIFGELCDRLILNLDEMNSKDS